MLTRLRHRAVGRRDHEDRAVHLRRTRDHALHVVGVPGAVDVRVVATLGLVLDVRDGDRDTALLLLGRLVDVVERELRVQRRVLVVQDLRDRRRQRRLAVVDVTDGADGDVRHSPLEYRGCSKRTLVGRSSGYRHSGILRRPRRSNRRRQCGTCSPQ